LKRRIREKIDHLLFCLQCDIDQFLRT
jgi:hypothetical protein